MKSILTIAIGLALTQAHAGSVLLEGKYQNRNLYVQNSFSGSGVGFCVYEVRVNGEVTMDEVNSSAFEIDLSQRNIKPGEEVLVEIRHKEGCAPKVLNPDALKPVPTFETVTIEVDHKGTLSWSTRGESGSLPYVVEQFKWNKWVTVGEVQGKGSTDVNRYTFQTKLTSGQNKFRVKQTGLNRKPRYSPEAGVKSLNPPVSYEYDKKLDKITFTGETHFEIYDRYGNLVKKGFGTSVDVANLDKALHYLTFDNTHAEFIKK